MRRGLPKYSPLLIRSLWLIPLTPIPGELCCYRHPWAHRRGFECLQEHSRRGRMQEAVYRSEGIIITQVLVTFNREVKRGHSRARWFQADCEFQHGPRPVLRKYPTVRFSVWSDYHACTEAMENHDMPEEIPTVDTDTISTWSPHLHHCWPGVVRARVRLLLLIEKQRRGLFVPVQLLLSSVLPLAMPMAAVPVSAPPGRVP